MHGVVIESLEEYLSGALEPAAQRDIEAHLSNCEMCREEIRAMREVSQWFGALRSEEVWEPAPGFCARVMRAGGRAESRPLLCQSLRAGSRLRPPPGVCVSAYPGGSGKLPGVARDPVSQRPFAGSRDGAGGFSRVRFRSRSRQHAGHADSL